MRRRLMLVLVLAAVTAGVLPASAAVYAPGRFGIGDSIMLSASDELAPLGYAVNAEVGRQFSAGVDVARRLANRGKLPRVVVIHLGTNGPIASDGCSALSDVIGSRQLFLVTIRVPRPWEQPNDDLLNACAASSERVHVIRWFARSSDHPEWFADDGYHLTAEGQDAYAALIDEVVDDTMAAVRAARSGS